MAAEGKLGEVSRIRIIAVVVGIVALVALTPVTAGAAERVVSVSAEATLKVPNDSAGFSFSVSKEKRSRGEALRATSSRLRATIVAVQKVSGVGAGDVKTGRISVRKTSRGAKTIYRASEGISVTLHEPQRAGELAAAAIGAGATGVNGPTYFVGDTEAAEGRALAAAFDKAKERATVLATQAGATLGPAIEIDEGESELIAVPAPESAAAGGEFQGGYFGPSHCQSAPATSGAGASACTKAPPPTKPGSSKVKAKVHVVFELR